MSAQSYSDDAVAQFLHSSVRTLWALETLLLLRRHADRSWSIADLVRELRSSPFAVTEALALFDTAGLVLPVASGAWQYRPVADELDGLVARVEELYRQKPQAVRTAILKNPWDKIKIFADAFKLNGNGQS